MLYSQVSHYYLILIHHYTISSTFTVRHMHYMLQTADDSMASHASSLVLHTCDNICAGGHGCTPASAFAMSREQVSTARLRDGPVLCSTFLERLWAPCKAPTLPQAYSQLDISITCSTQHMILWLSTHRHLCYIHVIIYVRADLVARHGNACASWIA